MKITIGLKIAFSFMIALILLSVMGWFAYTGLIKNMTYTKKITNEINKQILAGNLRFTVARVLMASNDYIITRNAKYINDFENINEQLNKYHADFNKVELTNYEQLLLEKIKSDIDSIRNISGVIFTDQNPFISDKAIILMETIDYNFGERINNNTTQIFDGISNRIENLLLESEELKTKQSGLILNLIGFGFLFSVLIILLTIHKITKPIKSLEQAALKITAGDYSIRPKVNTKDEIASLANSLAVMAQSVENSFNQIKENNLLLETIYSTIPNGLMAVDEEENITMVNDRMCDILQVEKDEISIEKILSLLNKTGDTRNIKDLLLINGELKNVECSLIDHENQNKYLALSLVSFIHNNNKQSLLIIEDITYRKQADKKLLQSLQQLETVNLNKDKLLSIISHDLRSPFTALLGSLNMLRNGYEDYSDDERKEFISIAYNVSNNLLELINDLLNWSRIQSNSVNFEPNQYSPYKIISKIVNLFSPIAMFKNINIITDCNSNLTAYYDENMIFTVLRNLLSNAIKFTNPEGVIEIKSYISDDELILLVKDSGVGISGKYIKSLFVFGENKSRPGTNNESGTGIGLILCKGLVEKNSGKIWVESKENIGTTFYISLPRNKEIIQKLKCA